MKAERLVLADAPHRALAFDGDTLVDWLDGHRYPLDGSAPESFGAGSRYRFDAAVGLGGVSVVYEQTGTKGVLRTANGTLASPGWVPLGVDELREIDRSCYQAEAYRFPVALLRLPDGREAIAHCPKSYDTLELELLDGTPLTKRADAGVDLFHSRLEASADGRFLLSQAWVWQPWSVVCAYDVERALRDPAHLSSAGLVEVGPGDDVDDELVGATFCGHTLVAAAAEQGRLLVWDLDKGGPARVVAIDRPAGTVLMAVGDAHVAALDHTPRVYALATGECVLSLDDLAGGPGEYQPSVRLEPAHLPVLARDPAHRRFAIGDGTRITVITCEP